MKLPDPHSAKLGLIHSPNSQSLARSASRSSSADFLNPILWATSALMPRERFGDGDVEAGKQDSVLRFPLRQQRVTIGRTGGPCDITIDDPHLALHHATLTRGEDHLWRITPEKTLNGVWVNIRASKLTPLCHFLCGEQFFRFANR